MTEHEHQDDLTQSYREASAQDERRPGAHVREAVRAHAQMVLDGERNAPVAKAAQTPAANQSHWKMSAFATVAVVGLAGLLVLQFERGTPEERDIAFGQPRAEAPQAAPAIPAIPAVPPAPATATPSPPAAQPPAVARLPDAPVPAPSARAPATGAAESMKGQTAPPAEKSAPKKLAANPSLADAPPAPTQASGTLSLAPAAEPEQAKARAPLSTQDNTVYRDLRPGADAAASRAAPGPAPAAVAAAAAAPAAPLAAAPAAPAAAAPAPAPELRDGQGTSGPPRQRAEVSSPQTPAEALLAAARKGQAAQLEALAKQGAPVNTADENGRTPLMLAVINGHAAAVKKLLALGANPALVDRYGLNALQHARKLGLTQIAALIEAGS